MLLQGIRDCVKQYHFTCRFLLLRPHDACQQAFMFCFFTLRLLFHARRWKFVLNSCLMLAYVRIINFLLIIIIICQTAKQHPIKRT